MSEQFKLGFQHEEILPLQKRTKLSMIVDPPNQPPEIAAGRVLKFLQGGGNAILIGGSGFIQPDVFDKTVEAVLRVTSKISDVPVWILPGDLRQIPKMGDGIAGVLNYANILGSQGDFEIAYPKRARDYVATILTARQIPSIRTLYVLCGDPNASVSQVSGILPLDLSSLQSRKDLESNVGRHLENGVDCVFFEAGSNSLEPANTDAVVRIKNLIDSVAPNASLIVSGGISTPEQSSYFAGVADFINIGGHFERNGTQHTADFVRAIN